MLCRRYVLHPQSYWQCVVRPHCTGDQHSNVCIHAVHSSFWRRICVQINSKPAFELGFHLRHVWGFLAECVTTLTWSSHWLMWDCDFHCHANDIRLLWIRIGSLSSLQEGFLQMINGALLQRSFILQGREELLTLPLTHHLRGHGASLVVGIPVFCLCASLHRLTRLRVLLTRTILRTPPCFPHEWGFMVIRVLLPPHPGAFVPNPPTADCSPVRLRWLLSQVKTSNSIGCKGMALGQSVPIFDGQGPWNSEKFNFIPTKSYCNPQSSKV